MKRFFLALVMCLAFVRISAAQQTAADAPASKEDVEKYLNVLHSREMMEQMMEAMSKPLHQMVHEQFLKDKDNLPPDFEERMTKIMDDYMKTLPIEEMLQAMVPAYQKHFTKGDLDALVAFYSSPTGQKVLKELPAITADAMQAIMPIIRNRVGVLNSRLKQEIDQMLIASKEKAGKSSASSPN